MELSCAVLKQVLPPLQVEKASRILIPPPDMSMMVERVARFVASIKPRLERLIGKNAGMRTYSFLNAADPYHAYYKQRVSVLRAQNGWYADEKPRRKLGLVPECDAIFERMDKFFDSFEDSDCVHDTVVVSPITRELVTSSKMSQHMQDPKCREERERLFAKIRAREPAVAAADDDEISETIVTLARKRHDIFDTTEEEICDTVIDEIIPERKQGRFCVSMLVPEYQFLAQHPGRPAYCIHVLPEQTIDMLEINVESLAESVSSFKDKIARVIKHVPVNKMQLELTWMPGPFQDHLSLAYYNVSGGDFLLLSW